MRSHQRQSVPLHSIFPNRAYPPPCQPPSAPSSRRRRTFKYLMGVLSAKWVLREDWLAACLEAQAPVDEREFLVSAACERPSCRGARAAGISAAAPGLHAAAPTMVPPTCTGWVTPRGSRGGRPCTSQPALSLLLLPLLAPPTGGAGPRRRRRRPRRRPLLLSARPAAAAARLRALPCGCAPHQLPMHSVPAVLRACDREVAAGGGICCWHLPLESARLAMLRLPVRHQCHGLDG